MNLAKPVKGWVAAAALAALVSGAAFRAAFLTGLGPYRMAGTILLVLSAWALASAIEAYQIARAVEALESRLAALGGQVAVLQLPRSWARRYRWVKGYLLVGPGGIMVAAALGLSNAARRGGALRRMDRAAASLKESVRRLKALAAPATGDGEAGASAAGAARGAPAAVSAVAGYGLMVLLRRKVHPVERHRMRLLGVGVANVEHIPEVLAPLLEPPEGRIRRLSEAEWRAVADTLSLRAKAEPLPVLADRLSRVEAVQRAGA